MSTARAAGSIDYADATRVERLLSRLPSPLVLGVIATTLIAVSSFSAGATRNRGGVLEAIGQRSLAYGHASGMFGALFWLGIYLLVFSWVLLGRRTVFRAGQPDRLKTVTRACTAWIVPLLVAAPILSRDVYSYLMQGAMLRDGFDPYNQGAAANPGPMLLEVSQDWRNTTTPYGPLHLWLGEGITRLVGDNITAGVMLYKVVSVIGMAAIVWSVPRIASRLGADPALASWLGCANPVLILHLVGGMHNESLMVGLVSLGLVLALDRRFLAATALIAIAVSVKATAAIAMPFIVWIATRHLATRWSVGSGGADRRLTALPGQARVLAFLASGLGLLAVTLGIIALVTWASGSSWGWLSEISGNSKVINPLSLPSLGAGLITDTVRIVDPSFSFNTALGVLRTIGSIAMLLGFVACWWLFKDDDQQAIRGIAVAYVVAFLCNAVSLPWYYASLITLIAVTPISPRLAQWATGLSVVLALAFTGSGNHQLYNVAYTAVTALAGWAAAWLLRVPRSLTPEALGEAECAPEHSAPEDRG